MKFFKKAFVLLCVFFIICMTLTACADSTDMPVIDDDDVQEELPLPQSVPNEELAGNNEIYAVDNVQQIQESILSGKTVYWLGSSVTYGDASMGEAVPDYIAKRNGCTSIKEAVSGTTLMKSNWSKKTYVDRLLNGALTVNVKPDLFICQLSTNDMYYINMYGEPSADDVRDIDAFDRYTTCGAIEYIIAYAKQTWDCDIAFYSNPYFEYKNYGYGDLVKSMKIIAEKWGIEFWNMYEDTNMSFSQFDDAKLKLYMRLDSPHACGIS